MLNQLKERFEQQLEHLVLQQCGNNEPLLKEMVSYHFGWHAQGQQRGKRLRPLILLLATMALGQSFEVGLNTAIALETFHNFTLVHDDIQDKGDYRQGRPALWKRYGMEQAINTGDFMAYTAQSILCQSNSDLRDKQTQMIQQAFTDAGLDVMRGQHLDMLYEHQESVSVEQYLAMINFKTARLFSVAFEMAGILNNISEEKVFHLREIGSNIGLAFQIQDDYLGIWGDPQKIGKSISTDILTKKKTYPILCGLSESTEMNIIWTQEAPLSHDSIAKVVKNLTLLELDQKTQQLAKAYQSKAVEAFKLIFTEETDARQMLFSILDGMIY